MTLNKTIRTIKDINHKDYIPDVNADIDTATITAEAKTHNYNIANILKTLNDGNLRTNFSKCVNITSIDYVASVSGIHWRTLNKYNNGYYEYLDADDTQKLLKAIQSMYMPDTELLLCDFPNIVYKDYQEQDAEQKAIKEAYRQNISDRIKKYNAERYDNKKTYNK